MNDNEQRTQHAGRHYYAEAYGDTPDELELSALDSARKIFGKDARLEIVRDYSVREVRPLFSAQAGGKKLRSEIHVLVHD